MKKYVGDMKKYVKNMKKYVENMELRSYALRNAAQRNLRQKIMGAFVTQRFLAEIHGTFDG